MSKKSNILNNSIGQIGYVVEDLDAMMETYYTKFGIGDWHVYTYGAPLLKFMNYYGKPANYKSKIGLTYFGNTRIELIQPLEGESVYFDFIEQHGYGVQHLGIYVPDMQAALRDAAELGFSVIMDGGGFGPDNDGYYAYLDTEKSCGITYELIERPKRRHDPDYIYPAKP